MRQGPGASWFPSLVNVVSYQLGWFACVLGATHGRQWLGPVLVLALLAPHVLRAVHPVAELRLYAIAAAIGLSWDSAVAGLGLIVYPAGPVTPPWAPLWIVALWPLLATTLNVSLRWLQRRLALAVLLGAALAPLAYLAGARLGALSMPRLMPALLVQALGWAVLLPTLLWLASRRHE